MCDKATSVWQNEQNKTTESDEPNIFNKQKQRKKNKDDNKNT